MVEEIVKEGQNVTTYLEKLKKQSNLEQSTIMGHTAYKGVSPRAIAAKEVFHQFIQKNSTPLTDTALKLEEVILGDSYFTDRNLYPNLEFYSGILFYSIGIPKNMFTLMQAIGKLPGWLAHWRELRLSGNYKKARPRQVYSGEMNRKYIPVEERK
jgi:citrate synthase